MKYNIRKAIAHVDFLSRNPVEINVIEKGSCIEIEQGRDPEVQEIISNLQENLLHKRINNPDISKISLECS